MTEAESLQARRYHLLEPLSRATDEIKRIDDRLSAVLAGNQDH